MMSPEEKMEKAIANLQAQVAADRKATLAILQRMEADREREKEEEKKNKQTEADCKIAGSALFHFLEFLLH
jgi:hypothetical protein